MPISLFVGLTFLAFLRNLLTNPPGVTDLKRIMLHYLMILDAKDLMSHTSPMIRCALWRRDSLFSITSDF